MNKIQLHVSNFSLLYVFIAGALCSFAFISAVNQYPVTYNICNFDYTDCNTFARFKSMDSCMTYKEHSSRLCSKNDNGDIVCKEAKSLSTVVSYCSF